MIEKFFKGRGKSGGGSVRTPYEAPNTLQSRAYVRFVDLISEGPIEGFCNAAGVTLQDAELDAQPTLTTEGRIYYDPDLFDVVYDDSNLQEISGYRVYGRLNPAHETRNLPLISIAGSGYPFSTNGELSSPIIGTFLSTATTRAVASVKTLVYPRTALEQELSRKNIHFTAHGFVVGDVVQRYVHNGQHVWVKIDATEIPLHHEVRIVRNVISADIFEGVIAQIFKDGRVLGLYVLQPGLGYETLRLDIPSAIGQAIMFDGTPLVDPRNLEYNFQNIRIDFRNGNEFQTPLDGFEQTETIIDSTQSTPILNLTDHTPSVVKTISGDWDELLINLILPDGLYQQDLTNGDITGIGVGFDDSVNLDENLVSTVATTGVPPIIQITQQLITLDGSREILHAEVPFGLNRGIVTIKGKTMSSYEVSVKGKLIKPTGSLYGKHQYKINFYRLTKNDSDFSNPSSRRSTVAVSSITGIVNVRMSYPFCAVVGVEIDAEQFSHVPTRSYRAKLLKIAVPSNYFPKYSLRVRTVRGNVIEDYRPNAEYCRDSNGDAIYDESGNPVDQIWDGSFYESWTDNPAWIVYNVCTDERIGLGRNILGANKWLFYRIGRYCDELVDSGWDGVRFTAKEPRFSCSTYFQSVEEAWKVLSDLCSSFAGYVYYAGGTVIPVQDRPRKAKLAFSPANVENGLFVYAGTHKNARYSAIVVKYNDPGANYKLRPVVLQDDVLMQQIGWRALEKTAFGCTSLHEARRMARRLLLTGKNLTDSVKFTTGLIGSVLRPGDVFEVYDPVRSSMPFSGRITEIYRTEQPGENPVVSLDRSIPVETLDVNNVPAFRTYGLTCQHPVGVPDGLEITTEEQLMQFLNSQLTHPLKIKGFSKNAKGFTTVILAENVPPAVEVGMLWGLRRYDVQPQLFQTVGVEEVGPHKYEVMGIEYQESLYNAIDLDTTYVEPPINPDLDAWKIPYPPRNLQLMVVPRLGTDGQRIYSLNPTWTPPALGFVQEYEVEWRRSIGNYQYFTTTGLTTVEITISEPDYYCVRVRSVGLGGAKSQWIESCTIIGVITGDNEEIISGLELTGQANNNIFQTPDASFDWRINWSGATSELHSEVPPAIPPNIVDYELTVYDVNMTELWVGSRKDSSFVFTQDQNRVLENGPYREFILGVRARTTSGGLSKETRLRVKNERPDVPTFTFEADLNGMIIIRVSSLPPIDFSHYNVWMSLVDGFVPNDATLVFSGNLNVISVSVDPGKRYYFRIAAIDYLANGILDGNISAQFSAIGQRASSLTVWNFLGQPWA